MKACHAGGASAVRRRNVPRAASMPIIKIGHAPNAGLEKG